MARSACLRLFTSSASTSTGTTGTTGTLRLVIGHVLRGSRRFTGTEVMSYSAVTGDRNPLHLDPEFASRVFNGGFDLDREKENEGKEKKAVVHGMLVASLFPSIIASHFPGAIYVTQNLKFKLPVYIGDTVLAEVEATHIKESKEKYIVKFTTKCFTNQDSLAIDGEAMTILPTLTLSK